MQESAVSGIVIVVEVTSVARVALDEAVVE